MIKSRPIKTTKETPILKRKEPSPNVTAHINSLSNILYTINTPMNQQSRQESHQRKIERPHS
ncbi:MAG: hypothetical protein [Inoviridae sp.]|nr:MAG: hypothetical protein [Inoviridae sp.]